MADQRTGGTQAQTCRHCVYFASTAQIDRSLRCFRDLPAQRLVFGECRARPPVAVSAISSETSLDVAWPIVTDGEWCGGWRSRNERGAS